MPRCVCPSTSQQALRQCLLRAHMSSSSIADRRGVFEKDSSEFAAAIQQALPKQNVAKELSALMGPSKDPADDDSDDEGFGDDDIAETPMKLVPLERLP